MNSESEDFRVTPLNLALPEVALLRGARGSDRRRLILIFAATAAFMAVVGVGVLLLLAKEEKTARHSATHFAAALVHNDPAAAPEGAAEYVRGVTAYFGPVTSAKVIGAHNKGVNTGDEADTRSFFVVELLLHAKKGPAVVEVAYDNHALGSETVSDVYELEPKEAPGLSARTRTRLDKALAERGGQPADRVRLRLAAEPASVPAAPSARVRTPAPATAADKRLRCVQQAHGDVTKIQNCAD